MLKPHVAYRFNPHFSLDAGVPIYLYINRFTRTSGTKAKPVYKYVPRKGLFGDTHLSPDSAGLTRCRWTTAAPFRWACPPATTPTAWARGR